MSPSIEQRENRALAQEIKFVVPLQAGEEIRSWARGILAPDPNAPGEENDQYQITSLYFDTPQWDVYHRNGSYGRCKYRIRRYGKDRSMFLERKLKSKGFVTKRRCLVPAQELNLLLEQAVPLGWKGRWFHERLMLRRLQPICQITYLRTARVTMTSNGPVRLTIDDSLRGLQINKPSFAPEDAYQVLLPESSVIELKFRGEMPVLFKDMLENFKLAPVAISKYRTAVKVFGIATPMKESLTPAYA